MKKTNLVLTGRNIYQDNHGQYIYHERKTNTGYRIPEEGIYKFRLYMFRHTLAIVAVILFGEYIFPMPIAILGGLLLLAFLEYDMKHKFLPKLTSYPNYKVGKQKGELDLMVEQDMNKLVMKIILFTCFSILLILNAIQMNADPILFVASTAIAIISLFVAGKHVRAIQIKRKNA
ncbi:MAG: hypothetical protein ACRCZJ_05805 [Erysipelotrichaceae bacterium]